jgi:hypothetical protein
MLAVAGLTGAHVGPPAGTRPIAPAALPATGVDIVPPEILACPWHDEVRNIDRPDCALLVDPYLRRLQRASQVTVRRLADEVDWALTLQDVTPRWAPVEPPPPGASLELPAAQMRAHCEQRGIDAEVTFRGPRSVVLLLREAIAAFAEADDLPWQACERLFDHVEAEWRSQPRHPDPVFERDGWRCAVPACSGRANLHDHHIVFRSHGGTNERSNRVTVCAAHHLHGLHGHRTRASGSAPGGIHWQLGLRPHGPPLMRLIGDRYVSA